MTAMVVLAGRGRRGFESFELMTPRVRDLRGVSRREIPEPYWRLDC